MCLTKHGVSTRSCLPSASKGRPTSVTLTDSLPSCLALSLCVGNDFPQRAVYLPPGCPCAVPIGQKDMEGLEPGNFLTTNVLEFYSLLVELYLFGYISSCFDCVRYKRFLLHAPPSAAQSYARHGGVTKSKTRTPRLGVRRRIRPPEYPDVFRTLCTSTSQCTYERGYSVCADVSFKSTPSLQRA
jgi:hypothetical protein